VADVRGAGRRALFIWAYALAAAFWIAFFAAWFVAPLVLCDPEGCTLWPRSFTGLYNTTISTDFVFFIAPLALSIGVLTQLFWEETAVAEPI
jgi:hypothetical protein